MTPFRRIATALTIGSFSIAALMGIVALLAGGDFGETEVRIVLTTLVVGCASICMLCYLATAGTRWVVVGVAGAVVLILPVVTSLLLVWRDWDGGGGEDLLKAFGIGVVLAVTLAQVALLLAVAGARDAVGFIGWVTIGLALVLAVLVSAMILGEVDAEQVWRLLGVIAILDVLGTLVTIAVAKFSAAKSAAPTDQVALTAVQAEAFARIAADSGRAPAELVAEALDQYLARAEPGPSADGR